MNHSSNTLKALTAFVAGLLVLACTPTVIPELSLSDLAANFEASGSPEKSISVTSNVDWTVSCPDAWVTVSPAAGTGNGTFKITVTANDKFEARSSTVTVKAGDKTAVVKVSQAALAPALEVNPVAVIFDPESSSVELKVNSNASWTVSVDADWLTLEPAGGQGDATVILTAAENNVRTERTAVVTVKETVGNTEKTVGVTQEALPLGHKADSLALVAIYNASDGANWTKGNWDLAKEMSTWTGVTLTDGRVTALKLTTTVGIPKNWTLPEEIADLTNLTDLRINKQKLSGEFPAVLCRMSWLKTVYLQGNSLTGALPSELGRMTSLTDLYVDQNASMSGSIPHEVGNLKNLMRLNISQSGIGGEIPVELGQCDELLQFMAFKCNLSGTLPDIWDMPKLQTVMIHTNPGLTGPLPASLGKLKKIATAGPSLQVYNCNITGNIPESFAELDGGEKKVQVHVYGNQMTGVVPAAVQTHKDFASWKINPQQEGYGLTLE